MNITIVGAGRAGSAFSLALARAGHRVTLVHHDDPIPLEDAQVVLLCVPDGEVAATSARLAPSASRVVAHVAGSLTLAALAGHPRVASLHPLVPLPTGERGAARLVGATYCVAGDRAAADLVTSLGGRPITLADDQRALYHATAAVAANHLVALMAQVGDLAEAAGLDLDDFLPLARLALADVAELGPTAALTGPASRGDVATIDAHLAAMPAAQRATYVALARAAFDVAERQRARTPA